MLDKRKRAIKQAQAIKPKRAYKPPKLIEYGSVAKLTAGTGTFLNDSGSGMRFRRCI